MKLIKEQIRAVITSANAAIYEQEVQVYVRISKFSLTISVKRQSNDANKEQVPYSSTMFGHVTFELPWRYRKISRVN